MVFIGSLLWLGFFALLTWHKAERGILLLLATTPLYLIRLTLGPIPTTLFELQLLILIGVVAARYWREFAKVLLPQNFLERVLAISITAFIISASVSVVVSPNIRAALGVWRAYFIEPVLLFCAIIVVLKTPSQIWKMVGALSVSAIVIALGTIGQVFAGFPIPKPWDIEMRATSIYPYPNAVGLFIAPIIPLVFAYICKEHGLKKIIAVVGSAALFAGIIFAKTTGALVALSVSGLAWLTFWSKTTRQWAIRILVSVALVILVAPNMWTPIQQKIFFHTWSGTVRQIIWKETLPMLRDHWITGAGLAGYQKTFEPYHKARAIEIFLYPHTIILNFWSEIGIYGLMSTIMLIALYFILLMYSRSRENRALHFGLIGAMVVLLIHGVVDVPYFKNDLAVVWWTLFAFTFIFYRHHQTRYGK